MRDLRFLYLIGTRHPLCHSSSTDPQIKNSVGAQKEPNFFPKMTELAYKSLNSLTQGRIVFPDGQSKKASGTSLGDTKL